MQHPRSGCSPWQQWNTFGTLSGYLINRGSVCQMNTDALLSLKLLSEDDAPAKKDKDGEGDRMGEKKREKFFRTRVAVRSP